jgi:ADP-ribose pyrophosphatase YjhB (NUDIX family)
MNKIEKFTCLNNCCKIKIKPYNYLANNEPKRKHKKSGVFIYDKTSSKVLLVQSRGNFWGPPKGTMKYGETERQCAVREVKEETGLDISVNEFTAAAKINNSAIYFYVERKESEVNVQDHIYNNDANGICWIKLSCLEDCIKNGNMDISKHCKLIFKKFLNIEFSDSNFIIVKK